MSEQEQEEQSKQVITNAEFSKTIAMPPMKRYRYAIENIAGWDVLYSLANKEGAWALSSVEDDEGNELTLFSVWSAPVYAESCRGIDWADYEITEINLEEFMDSFLPWMEEEGISIEVFPLPEATGFIVTPQELERDLEEELDKYE